VEFVGGVSRAGGKHVIDDLVPSLLNPYKFHQLDANNFPRAFLLKKALVNQNA
jgi:hypothetical protein